MAQITTTAKILLESEAAHAAIDEYRARVAASMAELAKHCADSRALIAQTRDIIAGMDGPVLPK